ncbi:MAG TPA: carbohydrate ABC transporter permease [Acidimicrobiales bacterium]|nr:carbohydrate ABC transporter permease [Acidimicrobiales bacterium]
MPPDPGAHKARSRLAPVVGRGLHYALLVLLAAIVAFPIYITVVDALLPSQKIGARPPTLFPTHPLWGSFATAFDQAHLGIYLRNSILVALAIVAAELCTSILAGYALAFITFPLRGLAFGLCLATLMVPAEATIIPNYRTIEALGWYNSFPALIVPFMASGIGIFLCRQAFRGMPRDLRDAATLDGYGHLRFLTRVVVPLNRPVLAAFGLYAFLSAWNQYLWPLIVTQTNSVRTVQIGLRQLSVTQFNRVDVVFAGTVLGALPIFVLLFVFQKQLVRGLTAGAVKG